LTAEVFENTRLVCVRDARSPEPGISVQVSAPSNEPVTRIPNDIIHWQEHAPDKRPTLFIY
jgi:hypothetical protein